MNSNPKQDLPSRIRNARAAAQRSDNGDAFLADPASSDRGGAPVDTDAESVAEEFIASATAGEEVVTAAEDEVVEEEWGGPFLELDAQPGESETAIPEPPGLHRLPPRLH